MPPLPQSFDLETLAAPIGADAPAGTDPREDASADSVYYRLREARAEARDLERQADVPDQDPGAGPIRRQWQTVRELAEQGLTRRAKDLELASWMTEALVREAGLAGLAAGALLIERLVSEYWGELFPMLDEDGVEGRLASVAGLSGQGDAEGSLLQPLRKAELYLLPDGTRRSLWEYQMATDSNQERRRAWTEAGRVAVEALEREGKSLPPSAWAGVREQIAGARESWGKMTAALRERAGADAPSTSKVSQLLDAFSAATDHLAPPAPEDGAPGPEPEPLAPAGTSAGSAREAAAGGGALNDREQALRRLEEVAAWFGRHEPNSPLAYTLQEAIRRGRMSWPDLIAELMPEASTRNSLLTSLGIKPVTPE